MNEINSNVKVRRILVACFALAVVVIIIQFGLLYTFIENNKPPQGLIIYRRHNPIGVDDSLLYEYLIMDGDGNHIQVLGHYWGSPTWSPDGKYLAVSCTYDVLKICILDAMTIPNRKSFPYPTWPFRIALEIFKKIDLPVDCQELVSPKYGIESISWSPNGQKLAVVCGSTEIRNITPRKVCILPFEEGESYCWEDFEKPVYSAVWSPVEDLLVVSYNSGRYNSSESSKIYLVGPDGKDPVFLASGWAAEWSPNGQEIAFARWQKELFGEENETNQFDEEQIKFTGIAAVNKDGTGFRWMFRYPDDDDRNGPVISFTCLSRGCRLSWSPDDRYIVFQARFGGIGTFWIFRLDLETNEIICLSCFDNYGRNYEPDWGP